MTDVDQSITGSISAGNALCHVCGSRRGGGAEVHGWRLREHGDLLCFVCAVFQDGLGGVDVYTRLSKKATCTSELTIVERTGYPLVQNLGFTVVLFLVSINQFCSDLSMSAGKFPLSSQEQTKRTETFRAMNL